MLDDKEVGTVDLSKVFVDEMRLLTPA